MIATFWQQMPFVKLIIPLILGIIMGESCSIHPSKAFMILGFCLALQILSIKITRRFWFEPMYGFLHFLTCFILGFSLILIQNYHFKSTPKVALTSPWMLVQTNTKPKVGNKQISFETSIIGAKTLDGKWVATYGKLQLSLPKDSLSQNLEKGDQILIKSDLQEISLPKNPGSFHYKNYMARKGIFYQQVMFKNDWRLYQKGKQNQLTDIAINWQKSITQILRRYLQSETEIGVSEALLFGLDDHIPDELINAYSKTGTLHVLAVSGMHVGLIYLILGLMFKPFKSKKYGPATEPYFVLLGIWLYALLCGLSPSILRACLMFSLMIIGKIIHRSGNPYNSLAVSAFVLLCINPHLVWHAGFQLSYAAVLGIIGFYKPIYQSIYVRQKILHEIWQVTAISLAAQILTFPISLFYFHQFPNYFLLANLVLIPLTTLLIYIGIALVVLHKITLLASGLAWLLSKLMGITNAMVYWIAALPGASFEQIYFPISYAFMCYLGILCLTYYLHQKSAYAIQWLLIIVLAGFGLTQTEKLLKQSQTYFTIYASPKNLLMSYASANKAWVWLNQSHEKNLMIIKDHFVSENLQLQALSSIDTSSSLISIAPKLPLLYLYKTPKKWPKEARILIMAKGARLPNDSILNQMKVQQVVVLQEVSTKQRKYIEEACKKSNRLCYDIASQGAFRLKYIDH